MQNKSVRSVRKRSLDMNRIIGFFLICGVSFGALYGNNEFLNADDWYITTNRFSSFFQPKCNSSEASSFESAAAAYKMYNEAQIVSENISVDLIYNTKLMLEFFFNYNGNEHAYVEFNFNSNSNYVYIVDSRDDSTRVYEDSNDTIYFKLINLHNSYRDSILK